MFILGERSGHKAFPQQAGGVPRPDRQPSLPGVMGPMGVPHMMNQQAMLAQQNQRMEALERGARERDRSGSMNVVRPYH